MKMRINYKIQNTNYKLQITNKKTKGEMLRSLKVRLKASKYSFHANFNALSDFQNFAAFPVVSVHLKKPSVGPKGLIGPPCHGAPGRRRQNKYFNEEGR